MKTSPGDWRTWVLSPHESPIVTFLTWGAWGLFLGFDLLEVPALTNETSLVQRGVAGSPSSDAHKAAGPVALR